ncbi:MAG: UDP-N-acetylmuramoyl-L-alanine--D-glutamate ligase [Desulfobulbus propionicus]|nr:MAG: UDP-N-acetylmuramoyl-L-alanine--D-glutamate ligase [Desulfobulbus propionicus]
MAAENWAGKKCVVLGCGRAGRSIILYLREQGAEVSVSEQRKEEDIEPETLQWLQAHGVPAQWGGHGEDHFREAEAIFPSPGVPLDIPVLKAVKSQGVPVLGELALAAGKFPVPVIGVTGSNGKTTVTSLLAEIFAAEGKAVFVGGNIGTPLLDFFLTDKIYDIAVLELSSFQLELTGAFRPDIALVLNISPDHLDRHHTMAAYVEAKLNIFANQGQGDVAVVSGDDPHLCRIKGNQGVRRCFFGRTSSCDAVVKGEGVSVRVEGKKAEEYHLAKTRMASSVNCLNAAAAVLAARMAGCPSRTIETALRAFVPPRHRMTEVAVIDGVWYINDSKATNVGAMTAALQGHDQVVLIAGGRDKGSDFTSAQSIVQHKVKHLIALGEAASTLDEVFGALVPVIIVQTMQEAVNEACRISEPGDVVLLAPGCASFDMFGSFEERGECFSACVGELM